MKTRNFIYYRRRDELNPRSAAIRPSNGCHRDREGLVPSCPTYSILSVRGKCGIKKLNLDGLYTTLKTVLHTPIYADNAQAFAKLIKEKPGLILASESISRLVIMPQM